MIEKAGRFGACNTASALTETSDWSARMATPRICSVEGCGKKHYARNYCTKHYATWRAHGNPGGIGTKHGVPKAWLEEHVGFDAESCLIWPFNRSKEGYSRVWHGGGMYPAHRLMCEMAHGAPPTPAHQAAHSCGNRICCNPRHIRWATRAENERDKIAHGTVSRGEKNAMAKLSDQQASVIREIAPFAPYALIAAHYGISVQHVGKIANGQRRGRV